MKNRLGIVPKTITKEINNRLEIIPRTMSISKLKEIFGEDVDVSEVAISENDGEVELWIKLDNNIDYPEITYWDTEKRIVVSKQEYLDSK